MDDIEKLAELFKSDDEKSFKKKPKSNPFNEVPDEVAEAKPWEKKPEDGEKGSDAQEDGDEGEENQAPGEGEEADEAGEGQGEEDEAAGEDGAEPGADGEDDADGQGADGQDGDDDPDGDDEGESSGDPDAEDGTDGGEGNPFDGYKPGEEGAEDDAEGAAVAGDGGAPNDVQGLIQAIVEQEKHYYAAKGMHGADHHKAGAQMDHYHALVRKLVRTLMAGPQGGQAPEQGTEEAPDDQDGQEAPDGQKAEAKDSKGFPPKKKKPPFMSKDKAEETAKALIREHYEVLQKAETAMRAKMGEFIDWSKKLGAVKEYDPAAEDKEDEKTKLKAKAGNSIAATVTGKTGSGDPIAAGRGSNAGAMSGIGSSSSSTPSASTMGSSSAAGQQAAAVSNASSGGATSSGRGLHGKMKTSPNSSAGQGVKAAGEGPTFKLPGLARSMDAIDALGAFAKASKGSEKAGHKYISRKANGHGGFDYVYEHPYNGKVRIETRVHRDPETGASAVFASSRDDGTRAYDSGAGNRTIESGAPFARSGDEHLDRIHTHATKDTHKVSKKRHRAEDKARREKHWEQLSSRWGKLAGPKEKKEFMRHQTPDYGRTEKEIRRDEQDRRWEEIHAQNAAAELPGGAYGPADRPKAKKSFADPIDALGAFAKATRHPVEKFVAPVRLPVPTRASMPTTIQKSFTDPAGRSLKKGLDVFALPGTSVPDSHLYDYLCAFVEEALEHEKRECAHQAPTTDTAEFWAGKVFGEFVGYRAANKNLQRADKKFKVTKESIATILESKGLVKTASDAVSSGRDFWDAPTSRSSTMQFSQRAPWVQADPTAAVGRKIVKAEPEQALFIDDTRDPSQVVRERQASLHKAAWSVPEAVYAADNHGTCQIHGREVHKAMNLSNPHLKCTC